MAQNTSGASPGPIFVAGTGRSGTTVLSRLIGTSAHVLSLFWEADFIVARNGLIQVGLDGWPPEAVEEFLDQLRHHWFRRTVKGTIRTYEAGLCHDVNEDELEAAIATLERGIEDGSGEDDWAALAGRFVSEMLAPATRRAGALTWCEKTPANLLYIPWLWQMFPGMRLVHIIRDGRDVASSMVKNQMWPISPRPDIWPTTGVFRTKWVPTEGARDYWVEMLHLGRLGAAGIPASNYLEIKLEELVHETDVVLETLFDFLGVPLDDGVREFPLEDSSLGRWATDLAEDDAREWAEDPRRPLQLEGYPVD